MIGLEQCGWIKHEHHGDWAAPINYICTRPKHICDDDNRAVWEQDAEHRWMRVDEALAAEIHDPLRSHNPL